MPPVNPATLPQAALAPRWTTAVRSAWGNPWPSARWALFQPDSGLVFIDDYNVYRLGPDGQDRTSHELVKDRDAWDGSPLEAGSQILRLPAGGFVASTMQGLLRCAPDGRPLWNQQLEIGKADAEGGWPAVLVAGPAGEIDAYDSATLWRFDAAGQQLQSEPCTAGNATLLDSRVSGGAVELLTAGPDGLAQRELMGRTVWTQQLYRHGSGPITGRFLADGGVLVGAADWGLARYTERGKRVWRKLPGWNKFDGRSYSLTCDGLVVAWWGRQLRCWNLDGAEAAAPIALHADPTGWEADQSSFIAGEDGNLYIQLSEPDLRGRDPLQSNHILEVDSRGQPLRRFELDHDNFNLFAVDQQGRLYRQRFGPTIVDETMVGIDQATLVCLEATQSAPTLTSK